jgi:hypothetical protein
MMKRALSEGALMEIEGSQRRGQSTRIARKQNDGESVHLLCLLHIDPVLDQQFDLLVESRSAS